MRLTSFAISICLLSLTACGGGQQSAISDSQKTESPVPRIINGSPASLEASPQFVTVNIQFADGTTGLCSGTAIDGDSILTAGHCLLGNISSLSFTGASGTFPVSASFLHPGYYEDFGVDAIFNDVAILKSASPHGLPALPILNSVTTETGNSFAIYGFGIDENGEFGSLKSASSAFEAVTPNHLFGPISNGSNPNPCNGDSGGAAIVFATLASGEYTAGIVGTVSSGVISGCGEGDVTLYANLQNADIQSFILEHAPGTILK